MGSYSSYESSEVIKKRRWAMVISLVFLIIVVSITCWLTTVITKAITGKTEYDNYHKQVDTFTLAGKITNPATGKWNNDRLVLIYEGNKEIARTYTYRGDFPESGFGMTDGLFIVEFPNPYRFSLADFDENKIPFDFHLLKRSDGFLKSHWTLYHWFPKFWEGRWEVIHFHSKNIYYVVRVLEGDRATLPTEISQPGSTEMRDDARIVAIPVSPISPIPLKAGVTIQSIVPSGQFEIVPLPPITEKVDNCKGQTDIVSKFSKSQTFLHKYSISGGVNVPVGIWEIIVIQLEAKYGFEESELETRTAETSVTAKAGTTQLTHLTWKEAWENGLVNVIQPEGKLLSVPYSAKVRLDQEITSETQACP